MAEVKPPDLAMEAKEAKTEEGSLALAQASKTDNVLPQISGLKKAVPADFYACTLGKDAPLEDRFEAYMQGINELAGGPMQFLRSMLPTKDTKCVFLVNGS